LNIKRGILHAFDASSYTATVLFLEATSYALAGVPVASSMDGSSAIVGASCAVLFFSENNPQDAVIIAAYDSASHAIPVPPAGRLTFVTGYRQINSNVITAGAINVYNLTGGSSGIPGGAKGVLYKAYFTSATVGAYIQLAPHGASDLAAYASIGNLPVANGFLNDDGLLALDSAGKIDIKANVGNCTVTLYTSGYVI
jgi:hypothetical protein